MIRFRFAFLLSLIMLFIAGWLIFAQAHVQKGEIPSGPDLTALQSHCTRLVSEQWEKWYETFTNAPVHPIKEVEFQRIIRADSLLTNIPVRFDKVNPLADKPVYIIRAVANSGFWKTTTDHLLVVQKANHNWNNLLHFSGGWNGRGIDFEIVDLGVKTRQEAIQIMDHASSNQASQTRTRVYRYDENKEQFREVFNQLTTWLPSAVPVIYESVVSFEESQSVLKDLVVQTEFIEQQPVQADFKMQHHSVFKWDGKGYAGKMELPIHFVFDKLHTE